MATKPSDLLHRLPSASELLEKPPIRALADRWNRSVVAAGVRSFLDELKADLERRAVDVQFPSLRELAERAARHVVLLQQPSVRPAINATGQFFRADWNGLPLADAALERDVAIGSSFVLETTGDTQGDVAAVLCRLTGADAATVLSSYAGAVWLVLAAIAAEKEALIARGEVGLLERECSLADVAGSAAVSLREVGSVNRTSAFDFETAITVGTAAILRHSSDDYRIVGETECVELEALIGLARDRGLPLVELLGAAPLVDNLPSLGNSWPSVSASIAAGTHLAIVRGNGLSGGPQCGILVGTRNLIRRIESHPMFAAWRAAPATAAALQATLALYENPQQLQQSVPLFQLLSASVENLRQRAERLAPQLAEGINIAVATAIPTENCLGFARWDGDKLPSYAIALTPANGDVHALHERLRNAPIPIVGRPEDDRLILDLRTVLPRQDQRMVDAVVGPANSLAKTSGETASVSSL